LLDVIAVRAVVPTACTTHGGGDLSAGPIVSGGILYRPHTSRASLAFNFSYKDKGWGSINEPVTVALS
jgi:hypothetical protein